MLLSMQTSLAILRTSSPFPSPPTHDPLSLHHLHIQGSHLHSICYLFLSLLLLKSDGSIISTVSLGKLTEALDTALVYLTIVAISKPCTEA